MKIYLNNEGKIDYDSIGKGATVQELLEAIDIFLNNNSLNCGECPDNCCKRSWVVEVDNVCVNRLCGWDRELAGRFIRDKLVLKENHIKEFQQYVIKKDENCCYVSEANLCTIYDKRPVVCRLYICSPKSFRYNLLRELIGSVFIQALVSEEQLRNGNLDQANLERHLKNPAVNTGDYSILLEDIIKFSLEEDWLYPEDLNEL